MNARIGLLAGLAVLAIAPAASSAANAIVPGRSIGPFSIGEERGNLRARGFADRVVTRTPNPAAPGNRNLDRVVVAYDALRLLAGFPTDEESTLADRLLTYDPRYRTAKGIGVGSTRSAVRAAYPAAVCFPSLCRIGVRAPGRFVTRFHTRDGRVFKVAILAPLGPAKA